MSNFYSSTASIAHKMLHMTYSKLNAESKKAVQERASALLEIVGPVSVLGEDHQKAVELIRTSLNQIVLDKPVEETGDVDTYEMCNAALNIFSIITT